MRTTTVVPLLALAVAALSACREADSHGLAEDELVLRGYPAPGRAEDFASAIGSMLRLGERNIGSARIGPGDQVLVLAPRSVHEGLGDLIRREATVSAAPVTPGSISMTYWFVGARAISDATRVGEDLREIEAALAVTSVQGPQEFRLIERLQLRQLPGRGDYWANSPNLKVLQSVTLAEGDILAFVRAVPAGRSELKTRVRLRPGQVLILGQVALDAALDPFPAEGGTASRPAASQRALYLVIRADVDPPA